MQFPGNDPFAGAMFTRDKNVRVGRADAFDELQHRTHGWRFSNQRGSLFIAQKSGLGFKPLAFAQSAP
jgi:hypothetical protein